MIAGATISRERVRLKPEEDRGRTAAGVVGGGSDGDCFIRTSPKGNSCRPGAGVKIRAPLTVESGKSISYQYPSSFAAATKLA